MPKPNRDGRRRSRNELINKRTPKLGYYLVATDAKATEVNYLNGFRQSISAELQEKIVIKVLDNIQPDSLVDSVLTAASKHPQYAEKWIVLDRDKVTNFDAIIERAEVKDVKVGWSNPCIEIWFMAYYGNMPIYTESKNCWKDFKRIFNRNTGIEYDKADTSIYKRLVESGDEKKAREIAETRYNNKLKDGIVKPSEMLSTTTLHNLICEIKEKIEKEVR